MQWHTTAVPRLCGDCPLFRMLLWGVHRLNGAKPLGQVAMSMKVSSVAYKLTGERAAVATLAALHARNGLQCTWLAVRQCAQSVWATAGKKMNPHLIRDMIVTYLRGQEDVTEHELEVPAAVGVPPTRLS